MKLVGRDCSPFRVQPSAKEADWLRRLAAHVRPADHVVEVSGRREEDDEPVVYCERDGRWWAGRYIGSLSFEGRTLVIEPRFEMTTLRHWLNHVGSLVVTETPGKLKDDDAFIAPLLAMVWSARFEQAARHGLPALRRQVVTRSAHIRGRLDVPASVSCMAARSTQVVSSHAERSLDHAASAAIVAAYEVLRRALGALESKWISARTRDLVTRLRAEIGGRPRVPTAVDLDRVRYTPITRRFKDVAQLSLQIANRRGFASNADDSLEVQGVLLDVAELWELYVIEVLRRAVAPLAVSQGTREWAANHKLLRTADGRQEMGTLIPDALIRDGERIVAIADAKYKRLHPTVSAPYGPQREDLYQVAAYLQRFGEPDDGGITAILLYPEESPPGEAPRAQSAGPWQMGKGHRVRFQCVEHSLDVAVANACARWCTEL